MKEISYIGEGREENPEGFRLDIRKEDIRPEIPEAGGTVLVLQVNAKDDRRDSNSPEFGALLPEAGEQVVVQSKDYFDKVFENLSEEDKKKVKIIVYASDASLKMPSGLNSTHRRAFETGEKVMEGIRKAIDKNGAEQNQLLNNSPETKGEPVGVSGLIDLTMFDESPEFVKYMTDKYGPDKKFWMLYEDDTESDTRLDMGAEGPSEIAIRMRKALTTLTQDMAKNYHDSNPDTLLYIWAISHYDSISPWVKGYVYQADPSRLFVPTEKAGGITIKIDKDNKKAETIIAGEKFEIPSLLIKPE